jgi:hypothetical protein
MANWRFSLQSTILTQICSIRFSSALFYRHRAKPTRMLNFAAIMEYGDFEITVLARPRRRDLPNRSKMTKTQLENALH